MVSVLPDGTLKSLPILLLLLFFLHLLALLVRVHFHLKTQEHVSLQTQSKMPFQGDSNCPLLYHWQKAPLASKCHLFSSMFAARAWLPQMDFPCHGSNQRT